MKWLFLSLFMMTSAWAQQIGKVIKSAQNDSVGRKGQSITLKEGMDLEAGDLISTGRGEVLILIYPGLQVALSEDTVLKLAEMNIDNTGAILRANGTFEFKKGLLRALLYKNPQEEVRARIRAEGVSFAIHGTELEVMYNDNNDVELDVVDGVVEASSPFVQSFVPEITKKGEGLRFVKAKRNFDKKSFASHFKSRPDFLSEIETEKIWKDHLTKITTKTKSRKKEGLPLQRPKKKKM